MAAIGRPEWRKGNPDFFNKETNPGTGRPKGHKNISSARVQQILTKHKRNPIEELINLADYARLKGDINLAYQIWKEIQAYREPKRRAVEIKESPITPEESKQNVEQMLNLLEEVDANDETRGDSDKLGAGETSMAPEISAKKDVPGNSRES